MQRHCSEVKHKENIKFSKFNKFEIRYNYNIELLEWMLINNFQIIKLDDNNFTSLFDNILGIKLFIFTHCRKFITLKIMTKKV